MSNAESQSTTPKALQKDPSYENFSAQCPYPDCGHWNVYNRASDLGTFQLISHLEVNCENPSCKRPFIIGGDLINPAWQMLILDCEVLKSQKRYAYCILNLAQAFEMYFSLFFRVELLYRPFARERDPDIDKLNRLAGLLLSIIEEYPFGRMRNAFVTTVLRERKPSNLAEAEVAITKLSSATRMPSGENIRVYSDKELANLLLELMASTVPSLRNNVVHKHAYRPTLAEVEGSLDETTHLLYGIDRNLGFLIDDVNYYHGLANGS